MSLTDEQLLHLASEKFEIEPGEYEAENEQPLEVYGSTILATMRAAIAADRELHPQPTKEALYAAYVAWFQANHGITPSPVAARNAAAFAAAVLAGEVKL